MCGINGIFSYHPEAPQVDLSELLLSRDYMTARGPDGCGKWLSDNRRLGLAHRRLSIIDLSEAGAQPMGTDNGQYHIIYNGEIYNYQKLRGLLSAKGVHFRSHSDTEVLLHLYRSYGEEMVHQLRGMFAFAIWDKKKQSLFLARDPYGIKPLYYSDCGKTFRFASQVKALQAGGAVAKELDPAGIAGFFLWGSIPEPFTLYQQIHSLPAGHTLTVDSGGPSKPKAYWSLAEVITNSIASAEKIPAGTEADYAKTALIDSVRAHMVADVPVGAFLSAGLDSSTIVGLAQEMTDHPMRTITLAFDEFKDRPVDEVPTAIEIAKHLGVAHHCITITMQEMEAQLEVFLAAMDQPTIDGINTWFVSKAASDVGLKVALSGLGGDELLGGYSTFQSIPRLVKTWSPFQHTPLLGHAYRIAYDLCIAKWSSSPPKNAGLALFGGHYPGAYQIERGIFMPWELKHILQEDVALAGIKRLHQEVQERSSKASNLTGFGRVAYLEATCYMRNQLLRDTDWVGMAHSLEIRVPLVDSTLTEKVIGLAATGRLGNGKTILPSSLFKGLPKAALERPKTGFTVPIWKWLRKSPDLDAWRKIKLLKQPNTHDYNRWAYSLISRMEEAKGMLK